MDENTFGWRLQYTWKCTLYQNTYHSYLHLYLPEDEDPHHLSNLQNVRNVLYLACLDEHIAQPSWKDTWVTRTITILNLLIVKIGLQFTFANILLVFTFQIYFLMMDASFHTNGLCSIIQPLQPNNGGSVHYA